MNRRKEEIEQGVRKTEGWMKTSSERGRTKVGNKWGREKRNREGGRTKGGNELEEGKKRPGKEVGAKRGI